MIKTKYDIRLEQQFLFTITKIIEICPQYTFSQHLTHMLRTKGKGGDPYNWTNEKTLEAAEKYYDELLEDLVNNEYENG